MFYLFVKFVICAAIILFAGKRVARYGDVIAEKTGLGGLWIGVVLVAVATSLPELFTGIGSTVFVNAPNLTAGNLFGANTYNLVNIATLDFLNKGSPLLSSVSTGQLLTAVLSLVPLSLAALGIFLDSKLPELSIANVSLCSILILASYLVCTRIIFKFEKRGHPKESHKEEVLLRYDNISLSRAVIYYSIFAVMIAGSGVWLAYIGDDLSRVLGLGQNFIGNLFLGFATTLPEITVSIAAIRLGAKEMAVANMLGSNLFNITIIFVNDLLYRQAPIFKVLAQQHIFTAFIVILMTLIVMAGLILKPGKKTRFGFSVYAILLIVVFLIGAYINFKL